ncbi:hypothetical protein QQO25_10245 [Corynebacterium lehmanniae]|nr:hypothetical protein [Corynebacterium lehmanniae]
MGIRGPIPKRSDRKHGRYKPVGPNLVKIERGARVNPPPADSSWPKIVRDWYDSLAESGQAQFFEPSDWATARLAAHSISEAINEGNVTGAMLREFMSMANSLLTTEGARRRLQMVFVETGGVSAREDSGSILESYREKFEDEGKGD